MWPPAEHHAAQRLASFSALTLGFFDVAHKLRVLWNHDAWFQCPNAGLLRCGLAQCPDCGDAYGVSVP